MNSAGITGNVPVSGPATVPQGERAGLDKKLGTDSNMFLQLLVAQMRYQDPLSSNQDTGQMITQLALFTLLESVIKVQQAAEKQGYASEQMMTLNLLNRRVEIIDEEGDYFRSGYASVLIISGHI